MIYTARFYHMSGHIIIMDRDGNILGSEILAETQADAVTALEDSGYVIIRTFEFSEPGITDFQVELEGH